MTAFADDWEDVPASAPKPSAAAPPQQQPQQQTAQADDWEDVPQWRGYAPVAVSGVTQGAVGAIGSAISGTAELPADYNRRTLATLDRVDRGEKVPASEDPIGYQDMDPETRKSVRADVERAAGAYKPQETPVYKAGEAVSKFGERIAPMSPTEKESITGRAAMGVGSMAPAMVAGMALGPEAGLAIGAGQFGLSSAHEEAEAARAKGATQEEAAQAARAGFALGVGGALLPIHTVLKPIERSAPGIVDWAKARLTHALQGGAVFATIGEAQEWLGQQIAQNFYDPNAGYSFDVRRVLGNLLGGSFLSALTPTPYHGDTSARAGQPAAGTTEGKAHTDALADILGPEQPPPPPGGGPTPEDVSILGGPRQAGERESLQDMLSRNAPVDELAAHPLVQAALKQNRAAVPTGTPEDFANPEWRAARVYNIDGDEVQGWDNAVNALTKHAEGYSPFGPVQNERRAIFVLGPPASGKSAISEPLARTYRAAIVDADDAKKIFPEYRGGLGTGATHEESSKLSKDVLYGLMERGANIILPKVGDNPESIRKQIETLKALGYTVDLAHVAATPEISGRRNIQRFLRTGRLVDPDYLKEVGDKPKKTAYMLRGEANDFADADTSQTGKYEVIEGAGALADTLRAGRYGRPGSTGGDAGTARKETGNEPLIGQPASGIAPHRVTAADGTAVSTTPIVVEADKLRTSQDPGYDPTLQPRQRERAASQAQVRDIAGNLDPERLGYSAEADRGAPIVGPDGMVESGNGRILALRRVYEQGGPAAEAYRDWLTRQGVDVSAYRHPVIVRQRQSPMTPEQRRAFTVAANQAATLAMSAPERAMSDAGHINPGMLGLIHDPADLGAPANRPFFRAFVAALPQSEQGLMADARGALSAEGLARVRNAVLAKAYGDAGILSRIAESTNDEVKSISNALTAAAPQWARFRAEVEAGRVRPDMDATPELLDAVNRTADIRGRGDKLDEYLAQRDAFDRLPDLTEGFMRIFYDPKGRRAASSQRISDAIRFYADEAEKVNAEKGLDLELTPVEPRDIQRLAIDREWEDVGPEVPDRGGAGDGAGGEAGSGEARGPWLGEGRKIVGPRGERLFSEEDAAAQQPTLDQLRERGIAVEKVPLAGGKKGEQYVIPGAEKITAAELLRRRAAEPMRGSVPQEIPGGLFGDLLGQSNLLDIVSRKPRNEKEAAEQIDARRALSESDGGQPEGRPRPQADEARAPAEGLTPPETVPNNATDLFGEEPNGPGPARPARGSVRQGAQGLPGGQQPNRPVRAKRPDQLSLFGGEPSGRPAAVPNEPVPAQPGGAEVTAPPAGPSVTKPPPRNRRDDSGRTAPPATAGIREAEQKIAERSRSNYRITPEDLVGVGGPKQKVRQNIDAIRTLKAIEDEGREATPGEKAVLVKYVGWGAYAQDMFAAGKRTGWENERDAFRALVTDEEFDAARASTLNAHFTSPDVIRGMWDALSHLGYEGGTALEPAVGVGHFIGLIPDKVAPRTAWTAVELDPLSARITKALYGGTDVNQHGFEELKRPSNYYDLAISNVPFGDYHISEKPYGSFPIHDFFFVKSLDKVRPGGVVAFITSRFTMDRQDAGTRRLLSKSADLVGAIRLPGGDRGAFAGNAGTQVTTDVLFLRKKIPGEAPFPGADWEGLKEVQTPEGPVQINRYFADHPDMMLGEMRKQRSMYRADEPVLIGNSEDLQGQIAKAAANMQPGAMTPRATPKPETIDSADIEHGTKDGNYFIKGGKLYQREAGVGQERRLSDAQHDRVARFIGMRGIYNDLVRAQLDGEGAKAEKLREELRDQYDAFVNKYGPINKEERTVTSRLNKAGEPVVIIRRPNFDAFADDPDAYKVSSIENYDPETGKAKRADIQNKDVIAAPREAEIHGPGDALAAVLNDTGRVDLDRVANTLGVETVDEAAGALGDLIYHDPDGRQWRTADEYLSGNVVKKLEEAREIAKSDPTYLRNVAALEKVQPTPIAPTDITAQFGAPWVPADAYANFLKEVMGASGVTIKMVPVTNEWKARVSGFGRDAYAKYGTPRTDPGKILDAALNDRQITVYDKGDEGKQSVNQKATEEARNKVLALKEAFTGDPDHGIDGWVWQDPERAERLAAIYNRTYNNLANRKFDGSHLTLPGLNPMFSDRQHRLDAVWRIIQNGNTLLAHVVGSGKTVTMIAAGMEQKRLGLINKPAYVVPNHMLEQFSREFIQAYPNAKVLVAKKEEMTPEHRKAFIAKAAANDWDGVIITHDAFGRINMNRDFREKFINDQIDELERVMKAEIKESGGDKKDPTVKALEKAKKRLEEKLAKLMNEERKDVGLNFEETGIDHLFVDEAHKFKNLSFITRKQRVKGLAQGDSQRAEDLFLKMQYLEQNRPGRSGVFATGTPVSNTMAELWTMQRFLQLDKLKERGLDNFDNWANTFGRVVNNMTLSADGRSMKEESSFSKFVNIPELVSLYSEIADTKTADMLNLPRPEVKTRSGAPGIEIVEAAPADAEETAIQKLVKEAEDMKGKPPRKGERNMLNIVTDGRKIATDGRLFSGDFDFNPEGKIAKAIDNISRIYQDGNADPAAPNKVQMVFLDMGVPQPKGTKGKPTLRPIELDDGSWGVEGENATGGTFGTKDEAQEYIKSQTADRINLYQDLKDRLVAAGIPAKEIAFIHDANSDDKKARMFNDVRSGKVRVILGSSEKMGVGTNVQDKLIAMHHLDAPWKPAEVEQRDGRIVRQGNQNPNVQIYRYVTKRSFDAFMWQKLDTKARFIGQVLSGTKGSRVAEDVDNPLPEAAEMKAAASGDPRIMEHAELDRQVRALTSQRRTFEATQSRATYETGMARSRIEQYEKALPDARADHDMVNDIAGDKFSVELGDKGLVYERKKAGEDILAGLRKLDPKGYYRPAEVNVGRMSGFDMKVDAQTHWDGTNTILKVTPKLVGRSAYSAVNSFVINEHTDPVGLMRRFEGMLKDVSNRPETLNASLKRERDGLTRLEKTLTEKWPKEKEYREALAKLEALTTELKAPKHPDVHTEEVKAQRPAEKIISAAVRHRETGRIFTGSFHSDASENAERELKLPEGAAYEEHRFDDGFITSTGRFVDRKQAWQIAKHQDDLNDLARLVYPDAEKAHELHADVLGAWKDEEVERNNAAMAKATGSDRAPKEFLTVDGKPSWAMVVDNLDHAVLGTVRYAKAADADFHHTFYLPDNLRRKVNDGEARLVWADKDGLQSMTDMPAAMRRDLDKHIDPGIKARIPSGWEAAGASEFGPQPGERVVQLGPRTVAHISEKYTAAEQKIAEAVQAIGERMAPQAQVRGAKAIRMEGSPIWGAFVDSERFPQLIAWSLEKAGEVEAPRGADRPIDLAANTVRHEIIHHLKQAGMIRPEEWKALSDAAKKEGWIDKYGIEDRYPGATDALKTEEAIAERFADWRADKQTIKAGSDPIQRLIRGAFDRMDLFMRRVAAAARQFLGKDATANDVFTRIETGEVGRRPSEHIEAQKRYFAEHEAAQAGEGANVALKKIPDWLVDEEYGLDPKKSGIFWINGPDGKPLGHVEVDHSDPKNIRVDMIQSTSGKPNELGPKVVRDVFRRLHEAYPESDKVSGNRLSGARLGPAGKGEAEATFSLTKAQAARQTETPQFKKWFGDSKVVDKKSGQPIIVYRGEHGESAHQFHTRAGSLTFGSKEAASTYATDPNNHRDIPVAPRVTPAYLKIEKPFVNDAGDPFIDFSQIEKALGRDAALDVLRKHAAAFEHTANWEENFAHEYGSVGELLKRAPEKAAKLYGESYPLLDDHEFIAKLKAAGFDGAITGGMGETAGEGEYRVFSPSQVKSAIGNRGTFSPFSSDIRAQTPGQEARERREAAGYPHSVWGEVTQASDKLRASAGALSKSFGVDQIVRDMQIRWTPMAARDATVESRAVVKNYMNDRRQAREAWNKADKYLVDHFTPERRKAMWDAADEESVALQQGRPTQGIGLDRLSPAERGVVEMLQRRSQGNFDTAKMLKMVQGEGLPSYVPRMLVRMVEGKFEPGIGPGSEVVRDIRTLALTNAKLEDAISAKQLVNTIAEIGERSGNPTVNTGSIPTRRVGAEGLVSHAIDVEMGKGFSDTTPNLKRRKYLTREETEAAANRAPAPDKDAPKWFTLTNPAFQVWRPKMVDPETDFYRSEVKRISGMTVPKRLVPAIDQHGETVWERVPIYVRSDFEGPLKAALKQDWGGAAQRALMSLKSKAMSVIMFSPLIHNQVEWGRALPAAPGKVLTFQTYLEGNRISNDPQQMREAISVGVVPIGGHGFMQDAMSIAEAPSIAPGHSLTAKGLGYGAQALGHLTRAYDPRAKADDVRRAVDWFGNVWHNTMLWDRVRDLQLGLWSHVKDAMIAKGYDPYSSGVAAAHFANRYAGALPVEAMSGLARGLANIIMFSRSFTMGNLGAYKDAIVGLPRDAQAMIQQKLGWDELQKVQSYVKRKSRAMLAIDAGLYYATLSALQSAFHTAGTVPTMATLGGMMAGNAAGMKAGRWGQIGLAAAGGAAGFGLASVLGASPGTRSLEEELGAYWDRFTDLLSRTYEHPGEVLANPFKNLTRLSSTSENEPGKEGRLLVGYDEDGTALYMRLPAGKVTEELIGYLTEPNDMFHRKLSTFAKPVDQILENNVGFGRKLYDPNADTPVSISHNIAKIAAQLVLAQLPGGAVMSAYLWARGGPGSSTEGLKTTGQATGFTFSKGYPGGPELGVLNDARERYEYRKQEAMSGIRDQIRQGDVAGAQAKMADLGIPPGMQDFYVATTLNPQARLTKRQMKDFMQYASPEEQQRFFKAQQVHAEGQASGGAVKRAGGGRVLPKGLTAEYALGVDKPWSIYDANGALRANGKTREEAIEALTPRRADGGAAPKPDYDYAAAKAAGVKPDARGHLPDTYKLPNHITFSDESIYHGKDGNQGGSWQPIDDRPDSDPSKRWMFTPGATNLENHSPQELQEYFKQSEPDSFLNIPQGFPGYAHGGRVEPKNINRAPTEGQKSAGNYAKDHLHFQGIPLTIENAKGSWRSGVDKGGKLWKCRLPAHYGYVKGSEGADGDHVDVYLGPHPKAPQVFIIDQHNAESGLFNEHKAMAGFASKAQAINCYRNAFSDGKGAQRIGHVTTMTVAEFKDWLKNYDTTKPLSPKLDKRV